MKPCQQQFVRFLETKQWSAAASISAYDMKAGNQSDIEWYFDSLMKTCNRWRVLKMVKTWLSNEVPLDINHSYGDTFYKNYGKLSLSFLEISTLTDRQKQRRDQFRELYFQPYSVVDPLALWMMQGKEMVDTLSN